MKRTYIITRINNHRWNITSGKLFSNTVSTERESIGGITYSTPRHCKDEMQSQGISIVAWNRSRN